MSSVCKKGECTACMACAEACSRSAITVIDDVRNYNPQIDDEKCISCGLCRNICQNEKLVYGKDPVLWYQGWAKDENIRSISTSGGLAAAIAKKFVEGEGAVCSCEFQNGGFSFSLVNDTKELERFAGSKYVKSNPYGIYTPIKERLSKGEKILMIALPCQIAAVKNFVGKHLHKNLYTIDLICHGTPSPKILSAFLKQYGYSLMDIKDIWFRKKSRIKTTGEKIVVSEGALDPYTLTFLNSINYTENCYSCRYAGRERVSDLTLGDSWGSFLSDEEKRKGISLALCMNEKGKYLLDIADLHLEHVDLEKAIEHNHQLARPCEKPLGYNSFFENFKQGYSYNKIVAKTLPKTYFNQKIKSILYRFGFLKKTDDYGISFLIKKEKII